MPQLLCPHVKSSCYLFDKGLGGPQRQSGCGGEEKNIPAPVKDQTPIIQPIAQSLYINITSNIGWDT